MPYPTSNIQPSVGNDRFPKASPASRPHRKILCKSLVVCTNVWRVLASNSSSCYFEPIARIVEKFMKLISSLGLCLVLSGCATDYASQLSDSNFGYRLLYSRDPA